MVRAVVDSDIDAWAAMRARLWPDAEPGELAAEAQRFIAGLSVIGLTVVFIAVDTRGPLGFLELSVRAFSDGCESTPVPHIEAWYVEPHVRRTGLGRALMRSAETWACQNGFTELASDAEINNGPSLHAHLACGFDEVERLIKFRKPLTNGRSGR
jgi:aminoglycoside 6'-N-acetyltransferase I